MIRRALTGLVATAATTCGMAFAAPAVADAHGDGASFALRAGRVMPVSEDHPWVIEDGVIVVRDGRIVAIGADVEPPADLPLLEMPDATIVPGFVSAASNVAGLHSGDRSIAAAHRAVDAFDVYGDYRPWIAAGVTTVHLNPGWHRLVSGQGAIVQLAGEPGDRVLVDSADLTVTLGPRVTGPPNIVEYTLPPSPDQIIKPARPQRPGSRMTQFLALREAIAESAEASDEPGTMHRRALRDAWNDARPIRVQADAAVDLAGAVHWLAADDRPGYLVGGTDAVDAAQRIADSGLPLVYLAGGVFDRPAGDLGEDPRNRERTIEDLAAFAGVERLAIAPAWGRPVTDLRLAAALAGRSGLSAQRRLEAITRIPAEILGVGDEVGSLAPGRRADLLVMTGDPLATQTQVQRAYIGGRLAYTAPSSGNALVVRAGTVWLGPGDWMNDGEILVEDGRITEVGRRVSRPPHARVVNAGADAWVTPGLIDAYGHLGLRGDRSGVSAATSLTRLVGAPDLPEDRVAASGVTSVMLAPYAAGSSGGQVAAIKTAGHSRNDRIIRDTAAVSFTAGADPRSIAGPLAQRLEAAKKYAATWTKYEEQLAEWRTKRAEGKATASEGSKLEETTEEGAKADPITGTWSATLSGGPLPEEQEGTVVFRLEGSSIQGRITEPDIPTEVRITGELDGNRVSGEIDVDTGGMGMPTWEGTIVEEDLIRGTAGLAGMVTVDFEMRRTDKAAVEFKVSRTRRTEGKDGRPLPPKVDASLEPLRAMLEGRIPAIVEAGERAAIDAVLDVLVNRYKVPVVIRGGDQSAGVAERLVESNVGVVLPVNVMSLDGDGLPYHQGRDLASRGVTIAFQSGAGDGARSLRDVGIRSVERGLSPEAALAAMTIDAARIYRLDDRIGSIAPGRDGDLVIFSGHPFEAATSVRRVFISGEEVRP